MNEEEQPRQAVIDLWRAAAQRKDTPVEVWIRQCEECLTKGRRCWRSEIESHIFGIKSFDHPRAKELHEQLKTLLDIVVGKTPEGRVNERSDKRSKRKSAARRTRALPVE
jgi:hypothetical protein